MRAIHVEPGKEPLVVEVDEPVLADENGVIVAVKFCGVCHSDVHLVQDGYDVGEGEKNRFSQRPGFKFPVIPGHETAGVVEKVGSDVPPSYVQVGDAVVVFSVVGCGQCYSCHEGNETLCCVEGATFLGDASPGGFAEKLYIPRYQNVIKIPSGLPLTRACMLACSALTAHNALHKVIPRLQLASERGLESKLAIIGLGGLGTWCLNLLKYMLPPNCRVVAADINREKVEGAAESGVIGCHLDETMSAESWCDALLDASKGAVDAVIDFVGRSTTVKLGHGCLKNGGLHVIIGLGGGKMPLELNQIVLKNMTICGLCMGGTAHVAKLLQIVSQNNIQGPAIEVLKMDQFKQAIDRLSNKSVVGRLVIDMTK